MINYWKQKINNTKKENKIFKSLSFLLIFSSWALSLNTTLPNSVEIISQLSLYHFNNDVRFSFLDGWGKFGLIPVNTLDNSNNLTRARKILSLSFLLCSRKFLWRPLFLFRYLIEKNGIVISSLASFTNCSIFSLYCSEYS